MIACDHIALRGLFLFLLITIANVISANAQITPITQYECDPRSTANGGTCPTGCNFTPAVEKGCNCFDSIDNDGDGKIDAADIGDCGVYFGLTFAGSGSSNWKYFCRNWCPCRVSTKYSRHTIKSCSR
jgi:hypothetical protein